MIRSRRIPCSIIFNLISTPSLLIVLLLCYLQAISPVKAASLPEKPLEPVNTSGPGATLRTFMTNADKAFAEFRKSGYRTKEALKYIQCAASTLTMSHIPSALHEDVGSNPHCASRCSFVLIINSKFKPLQNCQYL